MSSNNTTIDTKSKFAFLFPGQGSQAVGMGKELYENSPAAKLVFDEIDSPNTKTYIGTSFSYEPIALDDLTRMVPGWFRLVLDGAGWF